MRTVYTLVLFIVLSLSLNAQVDPSKEYPTNPKPEPDAYRCNADEGVKSLPNGIKLQFNSSAKASIRKGEFCTQIAQRRNGSFCYFCSFPKTDGIAIGGSFKKKNDFKHVHSLQFLRNFDPSRLSSGGWLGDVQIPGFSAELEQIPIDEIHLDRKFFIQCTEAAIQGFVDGLGQPQGALSCGEFENALSLRGINLTYPDATGEKVHSREAAKAPAPSGG